MSSGPAKTKSAGRVSAAAGPRPAESSALKPGLYIVATPIGNMGDITLRALETLKAATLIACEDTRVTGKLLSAYNISTRMTPYHEHNAAAAQPKILAAARTGVVALVSDAGTPLVSDPGYRLVCAAHAESILVVPLPGASSVMAALTLAGLPTDRFLFAGFLPSKSSARQAALAALARIPATLVFFESPNRIADCLTDMAAILGNRQASLTRELTKLHEEARRGLLEDLVASVAQHPPRGEIVLVVAPPEAEHPTSETDIDALLRAALQRLSVKDAAAEIASITGVARREVYARALLLAKSA